MKLLFLFSLFLTLAGMTLLVTAAHRANIDPAVYNCLGCNVLIFLGDVGMVFSVIYYKNLKQ